MDLTGGFWGTSYNKCLWLDSSMQWTNINDLALLLDEALIKMKEQSDNLKMNGGQKACKKAK